MRFFLVLLCVLWLGRSVTVAEQVVSDGIAAIVNDSIITYQDVETQAGQVIELLIRQYQTLPEASRKPDALRQQIASVRADATETLIARQLILNEYKSAGFSFPESIIEDTISERAKQRYSDRVTMIQTLKAQGITSETFRRQRREEIIIEVMTKKNLPSDIVISPQRIVNFYEQNKTNYAMGEQVKLRMIMLKKAPDSPDAAKQLGVEIVRKLNEGASFREMAKIYSEDQVHRATEGDWGWTERSVLRSELADVAFGLKPGQRSDLIDLKDSCWVLMVEDARPAQVRPLNEVREDIERNLRQVENERMRKKWITRLREKSFVLYF
jgi:peptidyl-prolyl cis-trans isomerase SurA